MTRPRRYTQVPGTSSQPPESQPPVIGSDRIRVNTDRAIGLAVPDDLSAHRNRIVEIVRETNSSGDQDAHTKLTRYLDRLAASEIADTHGAEIAAAREALRELLGRDWKDIADATASHRVLAPMFFNIA